MSIIIKTPFRSSDLETDPIVYGLRPEELRQAIYQLYNDKSLLITGTRGIGKSSFCYQLQKIIKGDDTLLKRCALEISMPKFITVSYVCTPDDTIETIILSIINDLEEQIEECREKYKIRAKEFDVTIFGIIKSKIAVEETETKKYNTLVTSFIEIIHKYTQVYVEPHINIVLDELDQINPQYNIAHFIKVVLEQLNRKGDDYLSFILVGQNSLFDTLNNSQPAFHRIVKHINLLPLDEEYSRDVLQACLKRAEIPTEIENECEDLFLNITCGYPYNIQLLGNETFNCMLERYNSIPNEFTIVEKDLLGGLKNVIVSEEQRYAILLENLESDEKGIVLTLADADVKSCPYEFTKESIEAGLSIQDNEIRKEEARKMVKSLLEKQIIREVENAITREKKYVFQEEIFRIYLFDRINNEKLLSLYD